MSWWKRTFQGILHAFDEHLNMVLEDVEEKVTTVEIDEDTDEELVSTQKREVEMLFVRGDAIILVKIFSYSCVHIRLHIFKYINILILKTMNNKKICTFLICLQSVTEPSVGLEICFTNII